MRWKGKKTPEWNWRCNTCGKEVMWRFIKKSDYIFYGCPNTPKCWGTMEMVSPLEQLMRGE